MKMNDNLRSLVERFVDEFDIWPSFKGKSFLITGANGTLGRGIIHLLLFANLKYGLGIKIYGSTRDPNKRYEHLEEGDPIVFIHHGKEDEELGNCSIDYIVHAACPTDRNIFINQPNDVFTTIIHDTERMINLANKKNARLLYLSSDAEYGSWSSEKPITESEFGAIDSLNYRSCYPLGKKASEFMCYSSFCQYHSNIVIARPSIILGLFQKYDDPKVMSYFLRCLVEQKNIILNTPGDTVKPMIFTLDAATACLILLLNGKEGEAYNITNEGICMSIREYAEKLCNIFGKGSRVEYSFITDAKAGFAATSQLMLNTDKLRGIGWSPLINFEELFDIEIRRLEKYETN